MDCILKNKCKIASKCNYTIKADCALRKAFLEEQIENRKLLRSLVKMSNAWITVHNKIYPNRKIKQLGVRVENFGASKNRLLQRNKYIKKEIRKLRGSGYSVKCAINIVAEKYLLNYWHVRAIYYESVS